MKNGERDVTFSKKGGIEEGGKTKERFHKRVGGNDNDDGGRESGSGGWMGEEVEKEEGLTQPGWGYLCVKTVCRRREEEEDGRERCPTGEGGRVLTCPGWLGGGKKLFYTKVILTGCP